MSWERYKKRHVTQLFGNQEPGWTYESFPFGPYRRTEVFATGVGQEQWVAHLVTSDFVNKYDKTTCYNEEGCCCTYSLEVLRIAHLICLVADVIFGCPLATHHCWNRCRCTLWWLISQITMSSFFFNQLCWVFKPSKLTSGNFKWHGKNPKKSPRVSWRPKHFSGGCFTTTWRGLKQATCCSFFLNAARRIT